MNQQKNQPDKINLLHQSDIQSEAPKKTSLPKWSMIVVIAAGIIAIGIVGYAAYQNYFVSPEITDEPVVCAMDAKLCPDGSSVGRIPPTCEFAQCPEITDPIADWQTYRNEDYGFEVKYPNSLIVQQSDLNKVIIGSEVMPYVVIQRYPSDQNIDVQSFVQQKLIEDFGGLLKPEEIKWTDWAHKEIFNQYALDVEFENKAGGYTGTVVWTYSSKMNWVYKIAALQGYNDITQKEFQNQILSTFKFID